MVPFIEQIMFALMLSSTYALISVGFTLFFGAINIVHFSHGDVAMLGSFIGIILYGVLTLTGILGVFPFWVSALIIIGVTCILVGLTGALFERAAIKPFRRSPLLMVLVATIALGIVIRESVRLFYPQGSNPQVFPQILPAGSFHLGELVVRWNHVLILLISILLIVLMVLFINRTKTGVAIRAISQDMEAANLMGINSDRIIAATFLLGSILAGLAGVLIGSYQTVVRFDIGLMGGIKGFSAAVVGGLGNFYGAIVGSVILGFVESLVSAYVPGGAPYKDVFAFLIVIFFLVFRPAGVIGKAVPVKI
jgi:branched-chain amino acid transport system permease protein